MGDKLHRDSLRFLIQKLRERRIWERVARERLAEPLHLNLLSLPIAAAGSVRSKIYFDLLPRQPNAFALLAAADQAQRRGVSRVTVIEFGVASGAGLVNLASLAGLISKETGVAFDIVGFDSGTGMPPPRDYRDHPDLYREGDFPMESRDRLQARLGDSARIIYGDVATTVPTFLATQSPASPLGYVVIDVDYYWSTVSSLTIFTGDAQLYLPTPIIYLDDVAFAAHNRWQGELLAVEEFNEQHAMRKISPFNFLRTTRLFKRATWINHMYTLHVLDHPSREVSKLVSEPVVLANPYL